MTDQLHRVAARGFTEANLPALASDLKSWRNHAALPSECKFHELASLCVPFASNGDEYQEAERLIITFAIDYASRGDGGTAAQSTNHAADNASQ
jgi:hypothetical protein